MRASKTGSSFERGVDTPWVLRMEAVAFDQPGHLAHSLSGTIVGCGGWVLSRGVSDAGTVTLLFEFERSACLDIYSGLVGIGIEFTRNGHLRFTELCQCTQSNPDDYGTEIASVDLEIQTYPLKSAAQTQPSSGA